MVYERSSYLQHTAFRVKDIHWHVHFFKEALGMPVRNIQGDEDDPAQVWTVGGLQFLSDKEFEGPEGRMVHLGIMCEDLEAALEEVYKWGVAQMPQHDRNWIVLPDGLEIELMQAPEKSD